jgi:hypothetical protein
MEKNFVGFCQKRKPLLGSILNGSLVGWNERVLTIYPDKKYGNSIRSGMDDLKALAEEYYGEPVIVAVGD